MFRSGETVTTGTAGGTEMSPLASAQAVSPSAHGKTDDHHGPARQWPHGHAQGAPLRLSGTQERKNGPQVGAISFCGSTSLLIGHRARTMRANSYRRYRRGDRAAHEVEVGNIFRNDGASLAYLVELFAVLGVESECLGFP
jgi:hypothetical protein